MKRILLIAAFLSFIFVLNAQNKISIKETQIGINTIDGTRISIKLIFNMRDGYRHRTNVFRSNNPELNYRINSINQKELVSETEIEDRPIFGNDFIGFQFEAGSKLMDKLLLGNADYFIEISDTITIEFVNDSLNETVNYILTPDQVKEYTRNKMILSEEEKDELVQSMGGELNMVANSIDFGFVPNDKSISGNTEYYINFNYRTSYRFIKESPVFFQSSGLLSTNYNDSLNYVRIYPIGFSLMKKRNEIACQAGIEANQVFSNCRISGDLHWQGIIRNFVDFTYGANRLRLKPVIQVGIKVYQEVKNSRLPEINKNIFSGIAYAQVYYYIPVLKIYSLTLDGNLFYDLNNHTNPKKEIKYLYSLTVGMEIPKSGIKTIFKYSNGETDISYSACSTIMIGIMADLFSESVK